MSESTLSSNSGRLMKPYHIPQLTVYGNISELTTGAGAANTLDTAGNPGGGKTS